MLPCAQACGAVQKAIQAILLRSQLCEDAQLESST